MTYLIVQSTSSEEPQKEKVSATAIIRQAPTLGLISCAHPCLRGRRSDCPLRPSLSTSILNARNQSKRLDLGRTYFTRRPSRQEFSSLILQVFFPPKKTWVHTQRGVFQESCVFCFFCSPAPDQGANFFDIFSFDRPHVVAKNGTDAGKQVAHREPRVFRLRREAHRSDKARHRQEKRDTGRDRGREGGREGRREEETTSYTTK